MAIDRLANLPAGADVFLDANVFIYSFGGQSNECRDLLRRCATENVFGVTTLEVINEVECKKGISPIIGVGVNNGLIPFSDFLDEKTVVLELKAVEGLQPIHEAQLLTYLKLGGWPIGLLINFNVPVLKKGIKRMVHNLK